MGRSRIGSASVLLCLLLAAPAGAQSAGNGLYEPFPSAASRARAERFVDRLEAQRPYSGAARADLDRGSFTGDGLGPPPVRAATERATASGGPSTASVLALAGGLLACCALAALRPAARRP